MAVSLGHLAETVDAIVRSPLVSEYKIGVSLNPGKRRTQYRGVGFDHLVLLDSGLTSEAALRVEEGLWDVLRRDRRSVVFRKFRRKHREGPYRRSLGGRAPRAGDEYCVYIAWVASRDT